MAYNVKGECRNTGRTHFKKGYVPWCKGKTNIYSKGTLEKISKATRERLLQNHPFKGKHHSQETKEKIRRTLLKRNFGKSHYDSHVYQNNFWRELRKLVYRRDYWKCQECGKGLNKKTGIACHHIDYDTSNNELSNLITLCRSCHGKLNYKKEEWINYYKQKMTLIISHCNTRS